MNNPVKIRRSNSTEHYFQPLVRFGKQTPKLLRIQNIVSLLSNEVLFSQRKLKTSIPSIERFYCSLLFVDISGFTKLSQELALDDLEIHINAYFKMILEIITNFEGEVIKFAGDALFVIWQCPMRHEEILRSLNMAIQCGLEINRKCSNYRILIDNSNSMVAAKLRKQHSATLNLSHSSEGANPLSHCREYFLNVHSSVSAGIVAGVDIGCNDRWEYFIIGKPLDEVALAEGDAKKGELVLSPFAHALLHPDSTIGLSQGLGSSTSSSFNTLSLQDMMKTVSTENFSPREKRYRCSCNCVHTASGCYKIDDSYSNTEEVILPPISTSSNIEQDDDHNFQLYEKLIQEIFDSFDMLTRKLEDSFDLALVETKDSLLDKYLSFCQYMILQQLVRHSHEADRLHFPIEENIDENFYGFITFLEQVTTSSSIPYGGHQQLHRTTRSSSSTNNNNNTNNSSNINININSIESTSSCSSSSQSLIRVNSSIVKKMREITSLYRDFSETVDSDNHPNNSNHLGDSLTAELRRVVTLFIRLDLRHLTLDFDSNLINSTEPPPAPTVTGQVITNSASRYQSPSLSESPSHSQSPQGSLSSRKSLSPRDSRKRSKSMSPSDFCFLERSERELESDSKLLQQYQICITVIITELGREGGQLRQFIVDDKGTVCIATFGLRGSVHDDGAAAAVETAQNIITQLTHHGVRAAVGISSGKVYCGKVGSSKRHEYAVMGPSVNLSARLMSKAKDGEIICDEKLRNEDRTHKFQRLAAVHAKGYAQPVPTYRPIFRRSALNDPNIDPEKGLFHDTTLESDDGSSGTFGNFNNFNTIFNFLFSITDELETISNLPIFIQSILEKSIPVALLDSLSPNVTIFLIDIPCKLMLVSGAAGVGKSHLLQLFRDRLSCTCNTHSSYNITVLFARCNNFNSSDQFYVWRRIFHQLMQRFSEVIDMEGQGLSEDALMDAILMRLPNSDHHQWKPLLKAIYLAKNVPDNEITVKLVGHGRIVATVSLLGAIIQLYIHMSSKILFLVMDDIHGMDAASTLLLQYIYIYTQGICILGAERIAGVTPATTTTTTAITSSLYDKNAFEEAIVILDKRNSTLVKNDDAIERVKLLEVLPLDYSDATQMIQHILTSNSISDSHDHSNIFDRVYSLSGGNPLYIHEIMTLALRNKTTTQQQLLEIIGKLRPKRIEEVISYRFDHLEENIRLVLKMASVAAYRGPMFNLSLLKYMFLKNHTLLSLGSGKHHHVDQATEMILAVEPADIIESLLTTKEFIKVYSNYANSIVNGDYSTSKVLHQEQELDMKQVGSVSYCWEELEFEFKTSIELSTIYEMMLDAQRTALHLHVAAYLDEEMARDKSPSYNRYNRIASHYNLAKAYHKSVVWHYRAALLLESTGAFQECQQDLVEAYIMFMMMKSDAGLDVSESETSTAFRTLRSFNTLRSPAAVATATSDTMSAQRKLSIVLSGADLYNLFHGDADLLELVLRMLAKLAQFCFVQGEDVSVVSNIYDEALQLLTACCALTPNKFHDDADRDLSNRLVLNNDVSYVFPILHGISRQYFSGAIADPDHKKDQAVCAIFLEIAESSPVYIVHQIVARFMFGFALQSAGRYEEAVVVFSPVPSMYDVVGHANQMIKMYSFNHILAQIAVNIERLVMLGDLTKAEEQLNYILQRIDKIPHNDSYSFIAHAVCNVLVLLGRPQEAVQQYLNFLAALADNGGVFFIFAEFRSIFLRWLRLVSNGLGSLPLRFPEIANHPHPIDLNNNDSEEEEIDAKLQNRGYFAPNRKWSSSMHWAFSMFSRGIENVCAEVCLNNARYRKRSDDSNLIHFAKLALEYVNFCIDSIHVTSSSLLLLSYFQSSLLKVRILLLLNDLRGGGVDDGDDTTIATTCNSYSSHANDTIQSDYYLEAIRILEYCWSLANDHHLVFICLCIGDFYLQLNLNRERGNDILQKGLYIIECRTDFNEMTLERWR